MPSSQCLLAMKASFGNHFLLTLPIGQPQSLCIFENKGILFSPSSFSLLCFFFSLFLSNQLSADHPSHFSLCPSILWTMVLIPSVLPIKALLILLGTAGHCLCTHTLLPWDPVAAVLLSLCLFQAPACRCLSWGPPGLQGTMSWCSKWSNV